MAQIINISDNSEGKKRQVHVDDLIIDKNNFKVDVLFTIKYLHQDNTIFTLPGTTIVQLKSTADNMTRINPLSGDFLGTFNSTGEGMAAYPDSVGEFDFLYSIPPVFINSIYPEAETIGELMDSLVDLMVKRMAQRGKLD